MPPKRAIVRTAIFILAVCTWSARPAAGQEPVYSVPANMLRFADFLFGEEDYRRAAVEYERYLSSAVLTDAEVAAVRFKIGLSFQLAEDLDKAERTFGLVAERFPGTPSALEARVQIARTLFLSGDYSATRSYIADALPLVRTADRRSALAHLHGASLLFEKRWADADEYFKDLSRRTPGDPRVAPLSQIAAEGRVLPRKNALIAGLLSTVVPGAGRVYAGRKGDAVMSFLSIAATAWQSYSGFSRSGSRSVKGWVYGSLAAFLYVGNIYGSAVAVQIRNERSEAGLLERAAISINVDIR